MVKVVSDYHGILGVVASEEALLKILVSELAPYSHLIAFDDSTIECEEECDSDSFYILPFWSEGSEDLGIGCLSCAWISNHSLKVREYEVLN